MAFLTGVFEGDFDAFKEQFDSDPLGRGSDVLQNVTIKVPPTVTEMVDQASY